MISFNHVTKKFGEDVTAIEDVDFTVEQGKIVVLLGPSGCGKTTLLRMVNRLESISQGEIIINGENSKDLDPIELRRKIGYVIQSNGLFPNMTIEENTYRFHINTNMLIAPPICNNGFRNRLFGFSLV